MELSNRPLNDLESLNILYIVENVREEFTVNCTPIWSTDQIILPTYDLGRHDEDVIRIYEKSFPTFDVRPIDSFVLANAGGIINCASKELPDPARVKKLEI